MPQTTPFSSQIYNSIIRLSSFSDLMSFTPTDIATQQSVQIDSYYGDGGRGGGSFQWSPTSTATEDLGTVVCPNSKINSITGETIFTGNGSTVTFTGTLLHAPIRPGTVTFTASSVSVTDNSGGRFIGSGISSGSINYATGSWSITYSVAPVNSLVATANYTYNSQGRWIRIYEGALHAEWYGARGINGDDTVPISSLLYHAQNTSTLSGFGEYQGVEIIFPAGTFPTSNPDGLGFYFVNGNTGVNITLRGAGYGTVFVKKTGSGNGSVISLNGDTTTTLNSNRCGNITLKDFTVDGNNEAIQYGIFLKKTNFVNINRVRAIRCQKNFYAVASSEVKIDGINTLGGLFNCYLDGAKTVDIFGVSTSVSSDRGFVENFEISNLSSYLPQTSGTSLYMNHCQNVFIRKPYIASNGSSTQHVSINSQNSGGADAPCSNIVIEDGFFELDANSTSTCAIDVRSTDSVNLRSIKIRKNLWTTLSTATQYFVMLNVNGSQTSNVIDSQIIDNEIYYTAGNTSPGLLKEGLKSYGTVIRDCTPLGSYSGSTFGFQTAFQDFTQPLTQINTQLAAVAEGAAFPGTGGTGWSGSVGTTAISRSSNANSFEGIPTLQLGDGTTTGTLTLDYTLDLSRFREKSILLTFLVQSNDTGAFLGLYPNGTTPDLTSSDTYFSRLDQKNSLTVSEANGTNFIRVGYVIPINSIAPGGSGNFGTASTCTLLIRFQRASTSASAFVRFGDIQVWESNRFFNRTIYN